LKFIFGKRGLSLSPGYSASLHTLDRHKIMLAFNLPAAPLQEIEETAQRGPETQARTIADCKCCRDCRIIEAII
jgi:hypothetical protein